jgi:hypothetical protein
MKGVSWDQASAPSPISTLAVIRSSASARPVVFSSPYGDVCGVRGDTLWRLLFRRADLRFT